MANPHNVELEAAKFLHKLIQDSKDEPTKLATKLYVILQHMRSSGKENSMPYQVISRAMETVIKQHGLDIEALMSSRHPLSPPGAQLGESGSSQVASSSQRTGATKDPKGNQAGNEMTKPDSYPSSMSLVGPSSGGHDAYQGSPSNMPGGAGKVHGMTPVTASSYPAGETGVSVPMQFASSSYDNHGFAGKMHKEGMEAFPAAPPSMDPYASKNIAGRALDHEAGANLLPNSNKLNQAGIPSNVSETSMLRNAAPRDTGKAPFAPAPVSGLPFKEHHLKQLRAQCLVFLAFRNGLMPKKLHLEIALGNFFPKEEGPRREMNDHKGKDQSVNESQNIAEISRATAGLDNMRAVDKLPSGTSSSGIYSEANFAQGADNNSSMKEDKSSHQAMPYEHSDERRLNSAFRRKPETEMPKQERSESQTSSIRGMQCDSNARGLPVCNREDDSGNNHQQPGMPHPSFVKHMKPEVSSWPGNGCQPKASKVSAHTYGLTQESQQRKEVAASQSQSPADGSCLGHRHTDSNLPSLPLREQWKPISGVDGHNVLLMPMKDSDIITRNVSPVQEPDMEDEDAFAATDCPPSPKYTTLEKWILDRQKRKLLIEKTWAMKQQKTEQKKIAVCSAKLKESVTSSEDINAKTKSVIELKKLKLLDLQRRLRSDILSDFFKPIGSEMDRLKSIKKHRIGRRSKQLERYEQKMKEERQKRIRERQKEFFSEVDVHRERLEDVFKMKRERWKGFNKYVREFHKRKERIHREKIDRIQREKINLLKINDVEGYLRMVQDAKSDRVKQLLKETEKYLQKLGSKLQEAKNVASRFETDVDDSRTSTMVEKNEIFYENEDETDQAKHYLESNEKYYMMAHSVKENVVEQPTMLLGGKLREYQMNGLRWLVSLYNNHLNGILADEMGLGKTVQVISLLCFLMENKNDRGPFLVVVPSSVLPGWEFEINFWAPAIQKIVYSGPPEERRRLFKEQIIHQKFNVLLTTYEYLMNKHDRPKLSKVHWHYIIIDEGHRIKNASCKLNADLKHYRSNHRLLLTGTPLQNNLEELWALLNFLLPNIFNSSEDFSQWFNKPFESNGDSSPDEALLSEEENLLIINRLHQVLRPFVLRRLKHKVENQLPEKIERLIRCEASAYQKLLIKRVEENLGAIGSSKARSVHNSVMELRNICNHPYLSQLHVEEVHEWIPKHYLPNVVRLCGKLEMLDRLLPKLKATDHRVLLFSTMTRLLDVLEDYLCWKQYKYLRLDGHTSGGDRGALIDQFNQPDSPFFIFLLSIRAGGVGVNLQAADTVIIFDTDWNPQVDLQAQARAHRIGQKRDVLVLRLETVQTVEEQVRASAEHKLGVANQSITAGFFDNNTSAEDRREYLESLLRECKKEEAAPVLDDDALNDIIARSESEIDIFEAVDKKRREEEMGAWMKLVKGNGSGDPQCLPPLPSRLLMEDDLKAFYEAMKISEVPPQAVASNGGMKRKSDYLGGLDTRRYGRGKRAREVRSYEEQLTEEEFEKLCQVDSPESPQVKEEITEKKLSTVMSDTTVLSGETQAAWVPQLPPNPIVEPVTVNSKEVTPPSKRGRGRPRRTPTTTELSPSPGVHQLSSGAEQISAVPIVENVPHNQVVPAPDLLPTSTPGNSISVQQTGVGIAPGTLSASLPPVAPGTLSASLPPIALGTLSASLPPVAPGPHSASLPAIAPAFQPTTLPGPSMPVRGRGRGRKAQSGGEAPRRRGKRQSTAVVLAPPTPIGISNTDFETKGEGASNSSGVCNPDPVSQLSSVLETTEKTNSVPHVPPLSSSTSVISDSGSREVPVVNKSSLPSPDAFSGSLGSQEIPVPNQSTLPASDALSGSLATTGSPNFSTMPAPSPAPANVTQNPNIMTAPFPNPVPSPAFPSVVSGARSTALADSTPKQGRGRGRKAQSGVEAPRRRGKRQNPEAPAMFEVSTDQDPKLVEVPEKKPRVNVGRRPTRRNKQEHDALKQSDVLPSVASQTIIEPAITQVSDSRAGDEAGKPTDMILLDASKNLANSTFQSAEDEQENEAQKPTNGVQAGASQGIEAPTVQGNKVHEENEAQKQADSIQSNTSQDVNCLPVGQTCDEKCGSEAQGQMNIVNSDFSAALADSAALEESKSERDNETHNPKEPKQLDPSEVIKDSSSASTPSNWQENEAQKPMHLVQSNPSPTMPDIAPTQASEAEQEDVVSKTRSEVQSDASQSISDPSRGKTEESEAELQTSTGKMDAPQCVLDPSVLVMNKDLLQNNVHVLSNDVDSDTPHTKPDPSVAEVQDVDQESEAEKDKSDTNAVISESVLKVDHADNKESDAQVLNNVVESDTVAELVGDKGSDSDILKDVMELEPKIIADPLLGEIRDVDQKVEAQDEIGIQLDMTAFISETVPMVEDQDNRGSGNHALSIVIESNTPHNGGDLSATEVRNIDQRNEALTDTDVQLDRTTIISGVDPIVEQGDNEFKIEPSDEVVDGFGEVKSSSSDVHLTLSSSLTPVSDILHGGTDDPVRNDELANKEPFPGAAFVSALPTEEHAVGVSNVALTDFNNISIEQDTVEVESKEIAASVSLASRPQFSANSLSEENSHSALAIVQSATKVSSSSVHEPENQSEEEHAEKKCDVEEHAERKCDVDGALLSDAGLIKNRNIDEKCWDDSVLLVSSRSGISSPNEQSSEALAAVSSYVSVVSRAETGFRENLTGEDGSKEVEQKDNFDLSKSSELLNVASVSEHVPRKLEDLHVKRVADDSGSKATGFNEVPVLKQLTVTENSHEMSFPTLRTTEELVQQLDTTSKTENKAWEEHVDHQENIDPTGESLVEKLEVTEVSSGKADVGDDLVLARDLADSQSMGDADELKNESDLVSTLVLADSQSMGDADELKESDLVSAHALADGQNTGDADELKESDLVSAHALADGQCMGDADELKKESDLVSAHALADNQRVGDAVELKNEHDLVSAHALANSESARDADELMSENDLVSAHALSDGQNAGNADELMSENDLVSAHALADSKNAGDADELKNENDLVSAHALADNQNVGDADELENENDLVSAHALVDNQNVGDADELENENDLVSVHALADSQSKNENDLISAHALADCQNMEDADEVTSENDLVSAHALADSKNAGDAYQLKNENDLVLAHALADNKNVGDADELKNENDLVSVHSLADCQSKNENGLVSAHALADSQNTGDADEVMSENDLVSAHALADSENAGDADELKKENDLVSAHALADNENVGEADEVMSENDLVSAHALADNQNVGDADERKNKNDLASALTLADSQNVGDADELKNENDLVSARAFGDSQNVGDADDLKNKNDLASAHALVDSQNIGDADELENENDLVSANALADSQSVGEITSPTCSTLKIEALSTVSVNEEIQIPEVELTSKVNQSFVPAPHDCETATNSTSAVLDVAESRQDIDEKTSSPLQILNNNVAYDGAKEESVVQHSDDIVTEVPKNRNAELVSNVEATCESFKVLEETTISHIEMTETRPSASDGNFENELDGEENTVSNAETTAESLKVLDETTVSNVRATAENLKVSEETTVSNAEATAENLKVLGETSVSNAEINETRSSPNNGEFENEVDMQLVEENPVVDVGREVCVSAVHTINLKDAMPDNAGFVSDCGRDDSEKAKSGDQILQKESLAGVDLTSAQSSDEMTSSDLLLETMNRSLDVPNAEVVEVGNAHSTAVFCDNNTNCAGNLLDTMDDARRTFGEEASSSSQTATLDVAPAELLVEKSEIRQKSFVAEVQGSKEVESEKIVASDPEAQLSVSAGSPQHKNGLQQLVEQYSDAATEMEVSVADSLTIDLRNDCQSSVDDSLKVSQVHGTSASPVGVERCSCPAENEETCYNNK